MSNDPYGDPVFQAAIQRELERIGGDDAIQSGLSTDGRVSPEDLMAALRATPAGGGSDAFAAALREQQRRRHDSSNVEGP